MNIFRKHKQMLYFKNIIIRFSPSVCIATKETNFELTNHKKVFSGIQPTGIPHIGNYFGAIKQWLEFQKKDNSRLILSIVDLHSITTPHLPSLLRENIRSMACVLLASGIDPLKVTIFQQSKISEHCELSWILGSLCTLPQLEHLPQWKQKQTENKYVYLGLFTYPILQAADILLYKTTHVPVGEDQIKHLELARDLAKKFNNTYANTFPIPKTVIASHNRIKSLRNPMIKMSKSDKDPNSFISIIESADLIKLKIKKAVTDCTPSITYDPVGRPGISNLINIYSAITEQTVEELVYQYNNMNTVQFKNDLSEALIEYLKPIRENFKKICTDKTFVDNVLINGNKNAKSIAEKTMKTVNDVIGFSLN